MDFNFDKPIRSAPIVLAVAVALGAIVVLVQPSRTASASTAMVSHAGHLADPVQGQQVLLQNLLTEPLPVEELASPADADVATDSRDVDQVGVQRDEP